MFHIAIADDNALSLNATCVMVKNYICENAATDITFTAFQSPLDLMASVESGAEYDAFLLDILMPGIDGISLAKELRAMGIGVPVIFITSEKEYALEAFHVGATQYLIKGFSYTELKDSLAKAIQIVSKERRRHIVLSTRRGYRHIFCRNIMYSVANKNYQNIVLDTNEILEVRLSHRAMTEKLTESINFIGIGSSYVVNMFYISELSVSGITMLDSFTIQIPQRQFKKIADSYENFFNSLGRLRPSFQIL